MENLEKRFDEKLKNEFEQITSEKLYKKFGIAKIGFICPKNKKPWMEWKKRHPSAYKSELDDFFDEVHPY